MVPRTTPCKPRKKWYSAGNSDLSGHVGHVRDAETLSGMSMKAATRPRASPSAIHERRPRRDPRGGDDPLPQPPHPPPGHRCHSSSSANSPHPKKTPSILFEGGQIGRSSELSRAWMRIPLVDADVVHELEVGCAPDLQLVADEPLQMAGRRAGLPWWRLSPPACRTPRRTPSRVTGLARRRPVKVTNPIRGSLRSW